MFKNLVYVFGIFALISCNNEFNTLGVSIVETELFNTNRLEVPVYTSQTKFTAVQTNGLSVMQLGKINRPKFGSITSAIVSQFDFGLSPPTFGIFSQENETNADGTSLALNENEKVTSVYLEIPFFNNQNDADNDGVIDFFDVDSTSIESDSDGDGIADILETQAGLNPLSDDSDGDGILDDVDTDNSTYETGNNNYEVDSIYGNPNATFNLKFSRLTYKLSQLNPNDNFESGNLYFSNENNIVEGFEDEVLFDEMIQINREEVLINYVLDDVATDDIDETTQIETRKTPRLRVPLDTDFFQKFIIDNEGSTELTRRQDFLNFIGSFAITTSQFSEDLYMLLDFPNASIEINYEYDNYGNDGTLDGTDLTTEKRAATFSLTPGVYFNLINNENVPSELVESFEENSTSTNLYIEGGQGSRVEINLLDAEGTSTLRDELRQNNWLINNAELKIFINPNSLEGLTDYSLIPTRLYLYRLNDNAQLVDFTNDPTSSLTNNLADKTIFGGQLESVDGVPTSYTFKIPSHISTILKGDEEDEGFLDNLKLGLTTTSSVDLILFNEAKTAQSTGTIQIPQSSIVNPFGVVLVGDSPPEELEDKRMQLTIVYTDLN